MEKNEIAAEIAALEKIVVKLQLQIRELRLRITEGLDDDPRVAEKYRRTP